MQKKYIQQQKRNACAKFKTTCGVNFSNLEIPIFLNLSKIYSAEFFLIFPVSSSVCNKKIFVKKYGVTGLVFKIDVIDGKTWVKFVAMQQSSATLIYDLNITKVQWRVTLKKLHSHSKQCSSKPEKSHLVLKVSKKPP